MYNFSIIETGTSKGYCYVWDESNGGRSSNEVATILQSFLQEKQAAGVKKFVLYSNYCVNWPEIINIFSMYVKASRDLQVDITHRYIQMKILNK